MSETEAVVEEVRALLAQHPEALEILKGRESLPLAVNVGLCLRGPNGEVKERRELHNLIVTAGKRALLDDGAGAKYVKDFAYIAIGTGAVAAALGDTTLGAEVARALSTVSQPDADTLRFTVTFAAGTGTGAITESGLLDASSGGTLLARQVFAVINKAAGDTLEMVWSIT
jgi:hypothetical protein